MAIGGGKFNKNYSIVDELKSTLNAKEIGLATSIFRQAINSLSNVIQLNDILVEQLKIEAINKVILLRGV